jgi:hypothetical protein
VHTNGQLEFQKQAAKSRTAVVVQQMYLFTSPSFGSNAVGGAVGGMPAFKPGSTAACMHLLPFNAMPRNGAHSVERLTLKTSSDCHLKPAADLFISANQRTQMQLNLTAFTLTFSHDYKNHWSMP